MSAKNIRTKRKWLSVAYFLKVCDGESLEVPNTFYIQSKNISVELHTKLVELLHTFAFILSSSSFQV